MNTPLFLSAVALILSLVCSIIFDGGPLLCIILIGLGVSVLILMRRYNLSMRYCALLLVFALGFCYGEIREGIIAENPFEGLEEASLTGEIVSDSSRGGSGLRFTLKVDTLNGESLKNPLKVLLITDTGTPAAYGDSVETAGTFLNSKVLNPGGFDYAEYQRQQDMYGTFSTLYTGSLHVTDSGGGSPLMRFSYGLKHRFEEGLSYLPGEQQNLLRGIFFGDTSGMEPAAADILSQSGIRHCFAVSGLHVGYILLLLNALGDMLSLGRRGRLALILPALFFYAAMTGFSPSVLRASLMCMMVLGAGFFGRERNSFSGLGAAVILILLFDPRFLRQAGFILSFTAMFSILFFMPWLERIFRRPFPGRDAFLVTVAAQIGMIPVLAYMFHTISILSFFISTICCFVVGMIVVLCFGAMVLSVLSPFAGALLLIPCGAAAALIMHAAALCVTLPFAYLYKGSFGLLWLLVIYGLLILLTSLPYLKRRGWLSFALVALLFVVFLLPSAHDKGELQITFLSVGEGDAAYVSLPSGDDMMIDACDSYSGGVSYYTIRPFLLEEGIADIEYVLLSHSDRDHSGSVPYLADAFGIDRLFLADSQRNTFETEISAVENCGGTVKTVSAGDVLNLGDGVKLEILWPDNDTEGDSNETSMVFRLVYGDFSVLFTGDAEGKALDALKKDGDISADILKVPHHGSKNSYDKAFYRAVDPDIFVISVGKNSYGHPSEKITEYCEKHYVKCLRTDTCGAVTVRSDGKDYQTETFLTGMQ